MNALVVGGQGFSSAALPQLRCFKLSQSAADGRNFQAQVLAFLARRSGACLDYLNDLKFDAGLKTSLDLEYFALIVVSFLTTYRYVFSNQIATK